MILCPTLRLPGPRSKIAAVPVHALLLLGILSAGGERAIGAPPRPYSLSLKAEYGSAPSRASYLEEIRRSLGAWAASTGPLGASPERGEADLHLRVVFLQIEVKRHYPGAGGKADVFFDTRSPGLPSQTFSTSFETKVTLLDPRRDDHAIIAKEIRVFNEQGYSEFIRDPRQRSWDVNVEFLIDRIEALLSRNRRKILRYLRQEDRLPSTARRGSDP